MKTSILIKDLIFFGACAEGYQMESCKLHWKWKYACECDGDMENNLHSYEVCKHQDNLFWSDRFRELGRTIKMGMQQDEITEVVCSVHVKEEDADKLRAMTKDAEDILGEAGMEYYDIFLSKLHAEKECDKLSIVEDHNFYTKAKDWYLKNDMTPLSFEEIKVNSVCKYLAHTLLHQLVHNQEAVIDAKWHPSIAENEEVIFEEHVCQINDRRSRDL
jgi:hypothetical protein